jgi:hypothetical protein
MNAESASVIGLELEGDLAAMKVIAYRASTGLSRCGTISSSLT